MDATSDSVQFIGQHEGEQNVPASQLHALAEPEPGSGAGKSFAQAAMSSATPIPNRLFIPRILFSPIDEGSKIPAQYL